MRDVKMNRDTEIQRIFEIADDSLQGVLGYHLYVTAMQTEASVEKIWKHLPDESIPHTFSWIRFYRKQDLTNAFRPPVFQFFQSRVSLLAMTTVFEVALENFIRCLKCKCSIFLCQIQRNISRVSFKIIDCQFIAIIGECFNLRIVILAFFNYFN